MNEEQIKSLTSRGWKVSDDDEGSVTVQTGADSGIGFSNVQVFFDQLTAGEDPGKLIQNWMIQQIDKNPDYGAKGVTVVKVHKMFP